MAVFRRPCLAALLMQDSKLLIVHAGWPWEAGEWARLAIP